jgi:hypothetical protein
MGAAFFPELVSTRTAILRCSSTCFKLTQSDCQEASKAGCAGACRAAYLTDITCLFVAPKMTGGRALGGGHSVPVRDHPALSHYVTDDVSRAFCFPRKKPNCVTHVSGMNCHPSLRKDTRYPCVRYVLLPISQVGDPKKSASLRSGREPLRATGSVKGSDCRRTTESVSRAPCPRPRRPRP